MQPDFNLKYFSSMFLALARYDTTTTKYSTGIVENYSTGIVENYFIGIVEEYSTGIVK